MNSWSYSVHSSAVSCLRKYKLCYIDKLAPDYESGDLVFGSALHSAINGTLTGDNGNEIFELYWSTYAEKDLKYGRFKWEELNQLGRGFCTKFSKLHAPKYKLEFAEERLYGEYRGVKLEGTLDFLGDYAGERSLRDFKTSGYNYAEEKKDTALQLNLYTYLAITNGKAAPKTLGYTVFNKGTGSIQQMTWEFDEKIMYSMLDDLVDYCTLVGSSRTYPKNLNSCIMGSQRCSYYNQCHGGKNE